ncbi:MAG: hypothetical protein Q9191_007865 [Dirinaria sp. TL-2023a]
MPPPLPAESDTESVAEPQTTSKPLPIAISKVTDDDTVKDTVKAEPEPSNAPIKAEADSESSDSGDEEIYIVEKIIDHRSDFADEEVRYLIKWKGYEKKKDRTWENEENLFGARELLEQYWQEIGGKPVPGSQKSKGGSGGSARKSALGRKRSIPALKDDRGDSESPAPAKKPKRGRKSYNNGNNNAHDEEDTAEFVGYVEAGLDDWKPPAPMKENWDPLLQKVDTIEQDEGGDRWVYLCWNDKNADGRFYRTKAKPSAVYKAAPQKMLYFYEQHL